MADSKQSICRPAEPFAGVNSNVYAYMAYGLCIHSDLRLPELERSKPVHLDNAASADLRIRLGTVEQPLPASDETGHGLRATADEVCYTVKGLGTFLVREGCEIIVDPAPDIHPAHLQLYLLGPVLGVALHQRGLLLLHGSAVAANGGAIAFLANSGAGKSTMAAALYARGYRLMTDDVVALDISDSGESVVRPGLPQIKLCSKSAMTIGYDPESLPFLDAQDVRLRHECAATDGFLDTPLPLRRIYVPANDTYQAVERLSPQAAFLELARHAYPDFVTRLETSSPGALRFHQRVKLANSVPVCCLKRQFSLSALPELVGLIEEDLDQTHRLKK